MHTLFLVVITSLAVLALYLGIRLARARYIYKRDISKLATAQAGLATAQEEIARLRTEHGPNSSR